jgi:rare lipoprotein A
MMKKESLLPIFAALVLGACATGQGPTAKAPVVDAGSGAKSTRAPSGGYLPGDGPGADTPSNLDSIRDAVPRAEPFHRYANRPYSALGKTYTPLQTIGSYKERGSASWYGKKFHGQRTSIGEVYDMYAMTAAHPTLPIPSYAKVTSVATGKSVVVRVNDRGPFLHSRIMDLSYVAAHKLGYINQGSAEVIVESIAVDGNAPMISAIEPAGVTVEPISVEPIAAAPSMPVETAATPTGQVFLQFGAFKSAQGAESFLVRMREEMGDSGKRFSLYEKGGLTRVHYGPYQNANEARSAASKFESRLGFKPFVSLH